MTALSQGKPTCASTIGKDHVHSIITTARDNHRISPPCAPFAGSRQADNTLGAPGSRRKPASSPPSIAYLAVCFFDLNDHLFRILCRGSQRSDIPSACSRSQTNTPQEPFAASKERATFLRISRKNSHLRRRNLLRALQFMKLLPSSYVFTCEDKAKLYDADKNHDHACTQTTAPSGRPPESFAGADG